MYYEVLLIQELSCTLRINTISTTYHWVVKNTTAVTKQQPDTRVISSYFLNYNELLSLFGLNTFFMDKNWNVIHTECLQCKFHYNIQEKNSKTAICNPFFLPTVESLNIKLDPLGKKHPARSTSKISILL